MKALFAFLALSLTCTAQTPLTADTVSASIVIRTGPACDGWYGKQVGSNCVLTFRFREMDGLTCVVNTNPSPDAGQSPVEIVCAYPAGTLKVNGSYPLSSTRCIGDGCSAMIDKKAAR